MLGKGSGSIRHSAMSGLAIEEISVTLGVTSYDALAVARSVTGVAASRFLADHD